MRFESLPWWHCVTRNTTRLVTGIILIILGILGISSTDYYIIPPFRPSPPSCNILLGQPGFAGICDPAFNPLYGITGYLSLLGIGLFALGLIFIAWSKKKVVTCKQVVSPPEIQHEVSTPSRLYNTVFPVLFYLNLLRIQLSFPSWMESILLSS